MRQRRPRSTMLTVTRSRSPPWSSGRCTTPPGPSIRSMSTPSSWPSRPRPQSGTSPPATPTPAAARAGCRCATTQKRSPGACRPRSPTGSSRPTRLSYAPEIAQAMLRQQQASAVVGARQKIVEGAVGMVQLALQRLEEQSVVELDQERKAAMVSNLLVVLCSEQATQQVVNTGSLYQ